ncbi:MAG: hypothetical protein K8T89_15525 [Planctomycetes bacterium]|nr:hypothetical protein [Planctomycetota bacterium]
MAVNQEQSIRKVNDAYTGILAISFLAMVGGTVLLYLDYQNYEGKAPPKAPVIDVPGVQLKTNPKTGGPPPKVIEPKPEDPMPPDPKPADPKAMMRVEPVKLLTLPTLQKPDVAQSLPPIVPVESVARPGDPVIQIPDVPIPTVQPVRAGNAVVPLPEVPISADPPPMRPARTGNTAGPSSELPAFIVEPIKTGPGTPTPPVFEPMTNDDPPPLKRFDPNK